MKSSHPKLWYKDLTLYVYILLEILVILYWFKDPAHRSGGESRINWPQPSPAKP